MKLPTNYDSTNKNYMITNNANNTYNNYLIIDNLDVHLGVEISLDVNSSTTNPSLHELVSGCGLYNIVDNGLIGCAGKTHYRGYQKQATTDLTNATTINQIPSINYNHNNWYTVKYQITNSNMKILIYHEDALIHSEELTNTYITQDINKAIIYFICYNGTIKFKNIKVKAL